MTAAPDDRSADPRISGLLRAMRAVHDGDRAARVPLTPGERDETAELCRLFNAIADRAQVLEEELERLRGAESATGEAAGGEADAAEADGAEPGESDRAEAAAGVEGEHTPAILVLEAGPAAAHASVPGRGPMGDVARTALRGLGGGWDQAAVLRVDSVAAVRTAATGHHVVSALLDARAPLALLDAVVDALDAELPGLPLLCFAPDDDPAASDQALGATGGRTRAEVVRSAAQAVERLTLHWLTEAPGAADPLAEPADPGYGQIRFEGEKVLVVDDDVRNVFAMVSALELYGLTAITADNGPEAVELLLRNPDIGIVLMDLMMPGLDGYATTARIRAYPEFADLPIIAVTARAAPGDRERSLAAGTDEHVTKPVEVDQLLTLIKRLIKRERQ